MSHESLSPAEIERAALPTGRATVRSAATRRLGARLGRSLGIVPFAVLMLIFLLIPIFTNIWTSLRENGTFSLHPLATLLESQYRSAFLQTFYVSAATALIGGVLGIAVAWALGRATRPRWLRSIVLSFSAVASQSGGIPLAFAFIATMGTQGLITGPLRSTTGWDISSTFPLATLRGVGLVYLYFQIPLMAVVMLPAFDALRREWREAASSLGASRLRYVRDVALPLLIPSIIGSLLLLFANSFGAYATAYALAGSRANLVAILVGFFLSGNVSTDPSLGAALVTGMIVVMFVAMTARFMLTRKSDRWLG